MTLAELISAQAKAGERYSAAIAELHAAFVDLAAIDGALANGNSGHVDYVRPSAPSCPRMQAFSLIRSMRRSKLLSAGTARPRPSAMRSSTNSTKTEERS